MNDLAEPETIIRKCGKIGRITLNKPKSLNAVTFQMVRDITAALNEWQNDPQVEAVVIEGAGDRAFAAGGDVKAIYDAHLRDDVEYPYQFWREEYELNARIKNFPKPYIAIMDGIAMGGAVGVSGHGSHRIVTERARIAMPETGIGLIPDVGGSWLLAHAPGQCGPYLGLTGHPMNAADAIYAGFADTYMMSGSTRAFAAELEDEGARGLDALAREYAELPMEPGLETRQDIIDRCFQFDSVEYVIDALKREEDDWAAETIEALSGRSPLCMKLALATIRRADMMHRIEDALALEYRCTNRLFQNGEFIEGIRALIIDKDHAPKWSPSRLSEIDDNLIDTYLAALPDDRDLKF